jgi:hypothetical protein
VGRTRVRLIMVLGAVVLTSPWLGDALAKKPTSRFVATVNGKRLKGKRPIIALYSTASFSVNAAAKPKRGLVRTVTANCGPVNIKAVPLPTTLTACYGSYTEAGRKGVFREWTGAGVDVTVESLDGDRIVGTLRGTLATPDPGNAGAPPATIEGGTFSMVITDVGV